jgi:O-succinylbenzoic acid--CoA ligase
VVLTHDAVAASAAATSARLAVTSDDHWLACLPLSHVGGLSVVTRALHTGIALTVLDGFDVDAVERSDASLVSLVATALTRLDPSRFRVIVLGGSRPPSDRPANCVTTYGMTETGSGVVYDGVPLDDVEVDLGDDGEIRLRGPMLLRCYRDGTSPFDADGWLRTGDLGSWRPDGRLHVEGRRGDLIITGGENVWPEAVEAALADHPGVAEVLVRGVDDPDWGQVVEALVVPTDDALTLDDLRAHVKAHHPAFMAPKRLRLVDSIPRTPLGKPRRTTT